MSCRICKSNNLLEFAKVDREKEKILLEKCNDCKTIQQKKICKINYNTDYRLDEPFVLSRQAFFDREYNRLPSILDYMKRKGKLKKNHVVVELGCGHGGMTKALQDKGYNVVGFDLGKETVEVGRANGANVFVGGIKEILDLKVKVDCIFSSHVFEHLYDPVGDMNKIRNCLTNNGVVVVETPNISVNPDNQWLKAHPYYFDEKSLVNCFVEAGFRKKYLNSILFGIFEKVKE